MAAVLKKRAISNFGFGASPRSSIASERRPPKANARQATGKSKQPKSDHPAFEAESDSDPSASDEEQGSKAPVQPPPRPLTILSNRASGLPSSPARGNGLPSTPARRMPGQSQIPFLRSSALARPPLQLIVPEQNSSLPTSGPTPLREVQSQVAPLAPVLSSWVQTPTVYPSNARSPPSIDTPQPSRTLPPIAPGALLRPSRPPSPETPAFDIIDAYDYMKRVTSDHQQHQRQQQQVVPDPLSPIYVPPPFTYTNALREEPIAEDEEDESFSHRQPALIREATLSLLHLQPPSEGGALRGSHDVKLPTSEDGPQPPPPPPTDLSGPPQVELLRTPHPVPETERAPPSVQSPEAMTNPSYLEGNTRTPGTLTPALRIITPSVPPVPPPVGTLIVGGANRRYTPLSIPRGVLSPGEEFSPLTNVGLARTPRTANFEVVMFGMGEDKGLGSAMSGVSGAIFPSPRTGVPEEMRGVQRWQTLKVSNPIRREVIEVKVHPPQGSVEGHEGQVALPARESSDTGAIAHDEEAEDYDEDDGGEFEMVTATGVAELAPPGGLDSVSDGEVDMAHTAVKDPLPPALSPLPSLRASSSSSSSGQGVEDDDWYPSLPTDGVVGLTPKNQGKPTPKPVPVPPLKVQKTNQGRDIAPKRPGWLLENTPPPVRPPRPPSLVFDLKALDGMSGGEEKQRETVKQLEGRREKKEQLVIPDRVHRKADEPGDEFVPVPEPIQVSLPMRIPTPPPSFGPLAFTLDPVSLSDMLGESTAPATLQPRVRVDHAPTLSPEELSKSAPRPTSDDSDVLGIGDALRWERAPVKPPVEPVILSDGTRDEFGRKDLGRHVATVQSTRREPDSFSPGQPHSNMLPTPNKSALSPPPLPPDKPLHQLAQPVPRPLPRPPQSVFESPSLVLTIPPTRSTIPPSSGPLFESPSSMPLGMLPILPPVPTSSPPRPKDAPKAPGNPKLPRAPRAPRAPQYSAPLPPREAPRKDLRSGQNVPASTPFDLAPLDPIADRNRPPMAPNPRPVPQQQVNYKPRSSSLPENQVSPKYQSSADGHAQPSPPNGSGMDQPIERATRSYYENTSPTTSRSSTTSGKEKKKQTFAGVVRALLKAKRENRKMKEAKLDLGPIVEHEASRYSSEPGRAEGKQVPGIDFLPPIGQAHISPPPVPQQPLPAFTDVSPQSLPTQGPTGASRGVPLTDRDGWVSRERVQPTVTGVFATNDVRDQPKSHIQEGKINAMQQLPHSRQASQDTLSSHMLSSQLSRNGMALLEPSNVVTALPPLVYYPSAPITTHIASISTRLETERDMATSGGAPIPSLNTGSISYATSTLSHLNTRIGEACAVLTQVIVSARVATGESGASSAGVDTQHVRTKVERDMRTRLCEFLTESIFGRFSVALGNEEDRALRESHGDYFARYPQLLSARWRVLACTSTAPLPEASRAILDSLLRAGIGAVLGNSNPNPTLVLELSAFLRPVFSIALELSKCIHMDMIEHDYGVFSGTPLGSLADLQVESHDPYIIIPPGARIGGFWSLGLRRARWEGEGEERRRITEVLVKPKVYVDSKVID